MSQEKTVTYMNNVTAEPGTVTTATIQALYGCPSLGLMIIFIVLISFGKRYKNSSFYKLVLFDLITNMCVYINTWIAIRFEMQPMFVFVVRMIENRIPGLMTWLKYFPYWFFHMHFWTAFLLTFHRTTSIMFPYSYEKRWNFFFPFIVVIAAVGSHLPRYFWSGFIYEVYIADGELICITYQKTLEQAINVVAIFSVIYFSLNTGNGLLSIALARSRLEVATASKTITKKLARIAVSYSMCYTAEVVWSVLNSANSYLRFMPQWYYGINNTLLVFASDLFTLSLPYILMAFDTNIQRDCGIKRRIDSQQGTIVVVSIQN